MIRLLIIIVLFIVPIQVSSQTEKRFEVNKAIFKCQDSIIKINKNVTEFNGRAYMKTDLIEFENADKITYDSEKKQVVILGSQVRVTLHYVTIQEPKNSRQEKFVYTIGEKIAYLY